jgi:hypothetical protein
MDEAWAHKIWFENVQIREHLKVLDTDEEITLTVSKFLEE